MSYLWESPLKSAKSLFFGIVFANDGKLSVDDCIECHDGFAARESKGLQFVVNHIEQVMVVAGIDLNE